jgi:hypothetical protein
MGSLAVVEARLVPAFTETLLECGLVFGGFGAMALWARRNRAALDCQKWCECARTQVTIRVIPSVDPCGARGPRPRRSERNDPAILIGSRSEPATSRRAKHVSLL